MDGKSFDIGSLIVDVRLLRHGQERAGIVIGFKPWRRATLEELANAREIAEAIGKNSSREKIEYPEIYWLDDHSVETVMEQDIKQVPENEKKK